MAKESKFNRFNSISPGWNAVLSVFLGLLAFLGLMPMILVFMISISGSESLSVKGYSFFPSSFTAEAYKYLMKTGTQIWRGYRVTIAYSALNTVLSLLVTSMFAYVIAQKGFKARKAFTTFTFLTMMFSGGMVPSYILNVKYLHLYDTFWIYILPGLFGFYNAIILRTFITTTIPDSLFEAAKIDGAGHFRIYFQIVMPLCKPVLASIGFLFMVNKWNDWMNSMLYITKPQLYSLQNMLQRMIVCARLFLLEFPLKKRFLQQHEIRQRVLGFMMKLVPFLLERKRIFFL